MKTSNLTLRSLISSVSSRHGEYQRCKLAVLETSLGEDTLEALPDHETQQSITSEAHLCEIHMVYEDR